MVMVMVTRKLLLVVSGKGKKYLFILSITILVVCIIGNIVFAYCIKNPLEDRYVIIDPGHGGIDGGTNDNSTFFEKDINLQISRKLQADFDSFKARASLTRSEDISLDSQVNYNASRHQKDLLARVEQFNSGAYEIFLSIHVNRSSNPKAIGPLVLYSAKYPESRFLAQCIQNSLNRHIKDVLGRDLNRKPMRNNYFILKNAKIPGVIVETGFISNPYEKSKLMDDAYQSKLSKAICSGVKDYFKDIDGARSNESFYQELEDEEDSLPFNITNDVRLVGR
ncbi:MAG TPA: N-acetylmuramoyl-L-alanine amidase [Candidatus Nitrosocosmicus sp.]|nr:N-acetylmuramoyl-L-alanine amidase [Candidatus Nitrosocosmicus sp.]